MRNKWLSIVLALALLVVGVTPAFAQETPDSPDASGPVYLPFVVQPNLSLSASAAGGSKYVGNTGTEKNDKVHVSDSNYIVQMIEAPVVAYKGGIPGLKATKPKNGQKIDPYSAEVVNYVSFLRSQHDKALGAAGGGRKFYDYTYSFNGFAAELTPEQAAKMTTVSGVVAVTPDSFNALDTSSTPAFLGLDAPGGLWEKAGGVNNAGENVIVGIIDGGIWPEHPSFSDRTGSNGNETKDGKLSYQQIPGWHGRCVPGDEFTASNCNQKIIGAQFFNAGFGGNAGIDAAWPWEYNSPRDFGGHGTHTASTAAGNANVPATGSAAVFGSISGIAPRARIAVYKVCWETGTGGTCSTSDSVAAIDQAVADGVDVMNYSISGSTTNFLDPVEVAFLFAADAGVFVAASAGNSGPTTSTVAHPGPWLTTVAAGTHNRNGNGSVTLGNSVTYFGASVATPVSAPLIDAEAAGLAGADPTAVRLCYAAEDNGGVPVLDPAKIAGKIVVCDRGTTARVNKSLAVLEAGGVGMILVNTSVSSINADFHFVPTVHLQSTDRAAVKAYAATPGATATINQSAIVYNDPAPFTASFSSRGPLRAGGGDLLKPDLIAPGQDVLAAVAPPGNAGRSFDLYSGTSMSSPHVAGLGALMKDVHPNWSPMMIKSALMTTGYDVLDGPNTNPLVIFRQGAGHVRPTSAADPGLVYNAGWVDWLGFLCGTGQLTASYCPSIRIDPSNLNVASIAVGDLTGTQTVKRTVTNVGAGKATYTASVAGLSGFTAVVNPSSLTLNPGESQSFEVVLTRTVAPLNAYTGGQLTWTDGAHNVRIPVVVRPVALAAPAQISGDGGVLTYNVKFGYDGLFSAAMKGLTAAATVAGTVAQDPDTTFDPADPTGTFATVVTIPAGARWARFAIFDDEVEGSEDLDLFVYNSSGIEVGLSAGGTATEEVNLANPVAGNYTVYVHGYSVPGPDATFTLFSWAVDNASAGNTTISAPASAAVGVTSPVELTFNGLAAGTRYLGVIDYAGATGMPSTVVAIKTP
jgi:subtilisin family serine protease